MGNRSKIEWTDATWNPVTGCSRVSEGCRNCYAERLSGGRLSHTRLYKDLTVWKPDGFHWTGEVRCHGDLLDKPIYWRKPQRIFVCSMSDLFHEKVPFDFIDRVMAVIAFAPQHNFMILTKRAERMWEYFHVHIPAQWEKALGPSVEYWRDSRLQMDANVTYQVFPPVYGGIEVCYDPDTEPWPLPNLRLGVSVEDLPTAKERIPYLLATPAACRFVSYEPALGPVNFWNFVHSHGYTHQATLDQIIVGGESGLAARPMHPDWARSVRDQCRAAGCAFFFKQWGEWLHESQGPIRKNGIPKHRWEDGSFSVRVGKKAAGRFLDGREWNEEPGM